MVNVLASLPNGANLFMLPVSPECCILTIGRSLERSSFALRIVCFGHSCIWRMLLCLCRVESADYRGFLLSTVRPMPGSKSADSLCFGKSLIV